MTDVRIPRRVWGSTGLLMLGRLWGSGCTLAYLALLARHLTTQGFGRFTFYLAVFLVLDALVDLGTGQAAVQLSAAQRLCDEMGSQVISILHKAWEEPSQPTTSRFSSLHRPGPLAPLRSVLVAAPSRPVRFVVFACVLDFLHRLPNLDKLRCSGLRMSL